MATRTPGNSLPGTFDWLVNLGVEREELQFLVPCVPGEFTLPDTYYVNAASPGIIYRGTMEGTLPLVAGRWYIIPEDVVVRHPSLRQTTIPVAGAVRRIR